MKRILGIIALLFILFFPLALSYDNYFAVAQETVSEDIKEEFSDEVSRQIEMLDMSSLEKILNDFTNGQKQIFGATSFIGKIRDILSGKFDTNSNIWHTLINCFFENVISLMPTISVIISISLIASMLQGLNPTKNEKSVSNVIHFITYGIVVVICLGIVVKVIDMTRNTIANLNNQMDAIFPILLTLLTAIGGNVSVSIYQPAVALLSGLIMKFFTYILLPTFIFSVVFDILSNLSNNVKLDKITSFFKSSYKWLMGLVFTIFTAFISIQGITAGSADGISIKTFKYAIKSYVPLLGSYLSDGMGVAIASSNLIKNTVGASGLFLLLATILTPIIEMVVCMLALKLVAGIIEPLGNKQIANFVSSLSKSIVLLIALFIGIGFVYFIMVGLVMCSANIV